MVTFEDIEKANDSIKPMKITRWDKKQGKEVSKNYAEVNQRIKAFRRLYPEGFIRTQIISHENGVVVIKAEAGCRDEAGNEHILGTGMAFENQKNGTINGTSYIENCETSAVGRALGMLGIGIDVSLASYEEVSNAMAQQDNESVPTANVAPPTPKPTPKNVGYQCCLCGLIFHDKKVADATYKKFNKYVCPECVQKKTEESQKKKTDSFAPPPPPVIQEPPVIEPYPNNELPFQI